MELWEGLWEGIRQPSPIAKNPVKINDTFMKTPKTPEYLRNQWKQSHSEVLSETLTEADYPLSRFDRLPVGILRGNTICEYTTRDSESKMAL